MDVHPAMTVATVRSASGRVLMRSVLETKADAITEFFAGMRGTIHVAFEEGTQAQWLYDLLEPRVDRVVVCNRRGEKRQGNKDDRVDADELSERLRRGGLRAVYHGNQGRADLKELTRAYGNLVEDGTRVMPEGMVNINSIMIMLICFWVAGMSAKLKAATSMATGTMDLGSLNNDVAECYRAEWFAGR
jgi:hypothetical protein